MSKPFEDIFAELSAEVKKPFSGSEIESINYENGKLKIHILCKNAVDLSDISALKKETELFFGVSETEIEFSEIRIEKNENDEKNIEKPETRNERRERILRESAAKIAPDKEPETKREVLYGNAFNDTSTIPLSELSDDDSTVCVAGRVFKVRSRETKTGIVFSFDITDNRSAVRVSKYFDANPRFGKKENVNIQDMLSLVNIGDYLAVKGKFERKFIGEREDTAIKPDSIQRTKAPEIRADLAENKRVELHLHTNMSELDALTDPKKLVERLVAWGHTAVAVTDHGGVYAFPDMMKYAEKTKGKLKVLYGCEGYLSSEKSEKYKRQNFHIILFALNETGRKNLYQLVSLSYLERFHYNPTVTRDDISHFREGLLVGSACEAGELFSAIVAGEPDEKILEIAQFYDYFEIQPVANNMYLLEKGKAADVEALRNFNRRVVKLGEKTGKLVVATGDVHFLDAEDEIFRRIMLTAKEYTEADKPLPLYLRTTEEMLEEFSYLGNEKAYEVVVTNTNKIANMFEVVQPIKTGQFFPPKIEGSADELRRLSMDKLHEMYGETPSERISRRVEAELVPIINGGYDVIYMAAVRVVHRSLEDGYIVGSRGSVGSSIIAFLAGITEVNPLEPHYLCSSCKHCEFSDEAENTEQFACGADMPPKNCPVCGADMLKQGFDIPFATFLGFNADKKPDIDLNFSSEYQARAHKTTIDLFGEKNVYRAGTIGTIKEKNALGFARKYAEKHNLDLSDAHLSYYASGCEGVRFSTGQHPGGLVVVPAGNDVNEFTPVQFPKKKKGEVITTHFDYHAYEDNLLKLDLLGHADPTMLKRLEDMTGTKATETDISDRAVMSLFLTSEKLGYTDDKVLGKLGTTAIPEFGTSFVKGMLTDTKPTTFDELVRISGLSHGTDVWNGNAADLIKDGTATLKEVICCRDDIMTYLINKGIDRLLAFKIMESVRKGKGLNPDWKQAMRDAKVPAWYIKSCEKIKYMFPKAHAAAYVLSSFRIARYKLYFPKEFYSAYFTIRAGVLDAEVMLLSKERIAMRIDEIRKNKKRTARDDTLLTELEVCYEFKLRGYDFEKIDMEKSEAVNFTVTETGLRLPFNACTALGEKTAFDIVNARAEAPFKSSDDIQERARSVNSTHIKTLRELGAMGDLPETMQISFL